MALWTPADLATPFKIIGDARQVTWSGSNFSSLSNTGSLGGSWATASGTVTKGTAINAINPMTFAGSQSIKMATPTLGTTRFAFYVVKLSSGRNAIFSQDWQGSASGFVIYGRDSAIADDFRAFGDGYGGAVTNALRAGNPGAAQHTASVLIFSGTDKLTVNGVTITPSLNAARTPLSQSADLYLGESGPTFGPEGVVGDIFWAGITDTAPSDPAELEKLQGWASWAFAGDGSLLPVGHPYKSAAPTTGGSPYTLTAAVGAFALAGQAAGLLVTRTMPAAVGAYALAGQAAGLLRGYPMAAAVGAFSLAGQPATLTRTRIMAGAVGTFALAGQAATLTKSGTAYTLTADVGTFSLAGQNVTLTYVPLTHYTLAANRRTFSFAGQNVGLIWSGAPVIYDYTVSIDQMKNTEMFRNRLNAIFADINARLLALE